MLSRGKSCASLFRSVREGGRGCGRQLFPPPSAARRPMSGINGKVAMIQLFEAHPSMHLTDPRAKILHFVRHAEGIHNAAVVEQKEAFWETLYNSKEMWDAPLTQKGKEQCAALAQVIDAEGVDVDLVVVSPLTRTLQTAELSFGTTHPRANMIAHELCRERIAVYTSEGRSDASQIAKLFPKVDFSLITDETDQMFHIKEKDDEVGMRAQRFLDWIMTRTEKRIAVVSHSVFLQQLYICHKQTLPEEFYTKRQDFAGMKTAMVCFPEED